MNHYYFCCTFVQSKHIIDGVSHQRGRKGSKNKDTTIDADISLSTQKISIPCLDNNAG